jgi:hypothetical protein
MLSPSHRPSIAHRTQHDAFHQEPTSTQSYDDTECRSSLQEESAASAAPTPATSVTSSHLDTESKFGDIDRYVALGCLHMSQHIHHSPGPVLEDKWSEILDLPEESKLIIGTEAARLLEARWIRLFLLQPSSDSPMSRSILRVYLLPEDWNRRFIDRNSRSSKTALRQLLAQIDTSSSAWVGDYHEAEIRHFDPWASAENVSLYYLFNKLPSPAPDPEFIKSRYTRIAVRELLKSAASSEWEEHGEQPLAGLRTRLYPYQARSASLMIQREAAPQLQLDPRLEVRTSPNGKQFYFGARDGSFLQEPIFYEANRGGILAETMGLGKSCKVLSLYPLHTGYALTLYTHT